MKLIFVFASMLLLTACTSARVSKNLSSGVIGCPANQITIQNETATVDGLHNWTAICNGVSYICSYQTTTGVNCSPESSTGSSVEMIGGL